MWKVAEEIRRGNGGRHSNLTNGGKYTTPQRLEWFVQNPLKYLNLQYLHSI
jgi:hypothetical protein